MPLTLILMRHAKSGWDDPTLRDHARTLTERGRRNAKSVGSWLGQEGHIPDLILCSDATRTGQTVQGILEGLGQQTGTQYLPGLYNASPDTILRFIHKQSAQTLLVCAHNPGIGSLAHRLVSMPPTHDRFDDYPTAATTVIRFESDSWASIRTGNCLSFIVPSDLKD